MAEIKTTYLPGDKVFVLIESCISEAIICKVICQDVNGAIRIQYEVKVEDEEGDYDYRKAYLSPEDETFFFSVSPESYLYPTAREAADAVYKYWEDRQAKAEFDPEAYAQTVVDSVGKYLEKQNETEYLEPPY